MVRGSSIVIKNLAILYPGLFIADKIRLNLDNLSTTSLWILELPESINGLEPLEKSLSYSPLLILSLSSKFL